MSGSITVADGALRQIIPLRAVPAQTLTTTLNAQNCRINVYQRTTGLFVDVGVDDVLVIAGVIARDRTWIIREAYRGFAGDLSFWDSQGREDPEWTALNTRFFLGYWPP